MITVGKIYSSLAPPGLPDRLDNPLIEIESYIEFSSLTLEADRIGRGRPCEPLRAEALYRVHRMKTIIREAALSDLPRLLELYKLLDFEPEKERSLDEVRSQFLRNREYPDYCVYVAEASGVIVGTFALIIIDSVAHGGKPFGVVEDVVVSDDFQGKGIGKEMMLFAMANCKKIGCYKLALSSHLKREMAHKFYESLGFEKHGFSFQLKL